MARKLNPDLYAFRWLAEKIVERGLTVTKAAEMIDRTPVTIYNWMTGMYLLDAVRQPNQKDDVAALIAVLTDDPVEEVRDEIRKFLIASGRISSDDEIRNFRSEVADFIEKMKTIHYYDRENALTPAQRDLIYSVLNVLDKI